MQRSSSDFAAGTWADAGVATRMQGSAATASDKNAALMFMALAPKIQAANHEFDSLWTG
jgi:hypothetical protein